MGLMNNGLFVDTNVLVYAALPLSPLHDAARNKLQSFSDSGAALWVSRQVIREFCRVLLSQRDNVGLIPSAKVAAQATYIHERFHIAEENGDSTRGLIEAITRP